MLSKFNWGHGITIFYLIFVSAVVTVLIASFSVDHSLVADDYYAQDLAYQQQYDKTKNVLDNKAQNIGVNVLTEEKMVEIMITTPHSVKGTIHFYRPSDQSQDFTIDLAGSKTALSTETLAKGKWILKIEWREDSKSFYHEHQIYIS